MSEEAINRAIKARMNRLDQSFLSNSDYAAAVQRLSEVQQRLYRKYRIFVPAT